MLACLFFSFINIFPYQVFESLTLSIILCVVASMIPPGTTVMIPLNRAWDDRLVVYQSAFLAKW